MITLCLVFFAGLAIGVFVDYKTIIFLCKEIKLKARENEKIRAQLKGEV